MVWWILGIVVLYALARAWERWQGDRLWELRRPDYELGPDAELRVDFERMTAKLSICSSLGPMGADGHESVLRRVSATCWESQSTQASHERVMQDLVEQIQSVRENGWSLGDRDASKRIKELEAELDEAYEGPKWESFGSTLSAKIEGDYQRFLHHGK